MVTIALIYGFAEGEWQGKTFRAVFEKSGFQIVQDPNLADIIVAHSGGCSIVPPTKASVTLQVGPIWPEQPFWRCFVQKISRDFRTHQTNRQSMQWLAKTVWNTFYILTRMPTNWRMLKNSHRADKLTPTEHTIIVHNRYDPWCSPRIIDDAVKDEVTFISLPGEHDDLWYHPNIYVDLLQSMYGKR